MLNSLSIFLLKLAEFLLQAVSSGLFTIASRIVPKGAPNPTKPISSLASSRIHVIRVLLTAGSVQELLIPFT